MSLRTLDAKGLLCPLPVLKARRAMKEMQPGETLRVLSTDAGAPKDFVHFCETTGAELLGSAEPEPGLYVIELRKTR